MNHFSEIIFLKSFVNKMIVKILGLVADPVLDPGFTLSRNFWFL
jgi:hypothetical protein